MVVAVWLVHWPNGFFMNFSGKQKGEGFEFHMLAVAILVVLMARGAGPSFRRPHSCKSLIQTHHPPGVPGHLQIPHAFERLTPRRVASTSIAPSQ